MKIGIILINTLFLSIQLNSQDYLLPKFGETIERYYWDSREDSIQIKYWPNGNTKVKYETINDKYKWRYDYNENGSIKFKWKIFQTFATDTTTVFDYDTFDETISIQRGLRDIPDGDFTSYYYAHQSNIPEIKETGYYRDGFKTGEWIKKEFNFGESKVKANFKEGKLNGLCTVYYSELTGFNDRVKYEGNYISVNLKFVEWNSHKRQFERVVRKVTRRTGNWIYYNELGDVIEIIEYNQK